MNGTAKEDRMAIVVMAQIGTTTNTDPTQNGSIHIQILVTSPPLVLVVATFRVRISSTIHTERIRIWTVLGPTTCTIRKAGTYHRLLILRCLLTLHIADTLSNPTPLTAKKPAVRDAAHIPNAGRYSKI